MSSTYSSLKIELIGTGEQAGYWGNITNTNLGTALEEAIVGRAQVAFPSDADLTLTLTDSNSTQIARHFILNVSGVLTATRSLTVPSINKPYIVENNTNQAVIVKTSGSAGVPVPSGKKMFVYAYDDGITDDVVEAFNYVSALYAGTLSLSSPLPVASGGTGGSSITYCSLATNVTGVLPIANGGTGQITANAALNALLPVQATYSGLFLSTDGTNTTWAAASGGGGGGVSSVNASGGTTGLSFTGGPVVSVGTLTMGGTLAVASGGTGAITHSVNGLLTGNGTSAVTTIAPGTNGQVLTSNGTNWYSAAFTAGDMIGPASSTNLAIPTYSGTSGKLLLNNSGATISAGTITAISFSGDGASLTGLAAGNISSGTLPIARGGTNTTVTPTNGGAVYGNGSSYAFTAQGSSGQVLTSNGAAAPTWQTPTASGGTVTDVLDGAGMNFTSFSTSGTITLGTPSTLTTSTTNATTAASHTHAITVPTPATFAWTDGAGSGPTGSLTVTNSTAVSYPAIPTASATVSGVVTTGNQTWAGTKTFSSIISPAYNFTASTSHFGSASSITSSVAGVSQLNVTTTAVTCSSTNRCTLGTASILWGQIYSSVSTISTSDGNYKQDIAELDEAERRVAVAIKGLIKKFRFKDAVAEKGSAARIHVGVIAQEVQAAFTAEGLDANRYGLFCSDTWWEKEVQVERNGITSTEMLTSEVPTAGYIERTRLGMRYEELLAFIISAL